MSTLHIVLPESVREFVESQVVEGGYRTVDEYVQALIREAQKRKAREKVEALLLEGLRSESSPMTAQDWEDIRREGLQRLAAEKRR
jgi:antitoxin ParD1/3/4